MAETAGSSTPRRGPTTRQALLGLFIVGQILFLVVSNGVGFVQHVRSEAGAEARLVMGHLAPGFPDQEGHIWKLADTLEKTTRMWSQATGQPQDWSLFATVSNQCVFLALQLSWEDDAPQAPKPEMNWAPETILSDNEPADVESYLRLGRFRLRRYENNLVITLRADADETEAAKLQRWSEKIHSHVKEYGSMLHAYARWRLPQVMARLPGRAEPRQVILLLRRHQINEPAQAPPFWLEVEEVPLARWLPELPVDENQPLEWWDPVNRRFQRLRP